MRQVFYLLFFLNFQSVIIGQSIDVEFIPVYQGKKIVLGEEYNQVSIETLRFYVSNVELRQKDKVIFIEEKSYHLIDLAQSTSLTFQLNPTQKYNQLVFNLGIDSTTNVVGVMGGDLDPMKGMYWAWQSGYINFKLEGKSPKCPARLNEYQFHLGGYLPPHQSMQLVQLDCKNQKKLVVMLELSTFFEEVDLAKKYRIMSPSMDAKELMTKVAKMFYVYEK